MKGLLIEGIEVCYQPNSQTGSRTNDKQETASSFSVPVWSGTAASELPPDRCGWPAAGRRVSNPGLPSPAALLPSSGPSLDSLALGVKQAFENLPREPPAESLGCLLNVFPSRGRESRVTSAVEAECQGAQTHGDDAGSCLISHGDDVSEPGLYGQPQSSRHGDPSDT